jgi:hypothetical protein
LPEAGVAARAERFGTLVMMMRSSRRWRKLHTLLHEIDDLFRRTHYGYCYFLTENILLPMLPSKKTNLSQEKATKSTLALRCKSMKK